MALIRCKVCGKQISDRARVCPHCGARGKVTLRKKTSADEESAQTVSPSQSTTSPNGGQSAKPSALYTPPLETQSKAPMVIAIVLIVVLLGIGAMFFFLLNPRSHRSTTEDYADTVAAQSSGDYSWGTAKGKTSSKQTKARPVRNPTAIERSTFSMRRLAVALQQIR